MARAAHAGREYLRRVLELAPDAIIVSTCGYISRDLHDVADRDQNFYVLGSMGAALPLALGVASAKPARRVVAVDGDGSLLMNLGATVMVGAQKPRNLLHLILDNGVHESTGGQLTVGAARAPALLRAAGYTRVVTLESPGLMTTEVVHAAGPCALYAPVTRREAQPPPRVAIAPARLVERFRSNLGANPAERESVPDPRGRRLDRPEPTAQADGRSRARRRSMSGPR